MDKKRVLIELPIDLYEDVVREAIREERSIRSTINILIKRGMERRQQND